MRESTVNINLNSSMQAVKELGKAKPFGAHFVTKLQGVNNKLICALSRMPDNPDPPDIPPGTCVDD